MIGIICFERGIPCNIESLARDEYVPALCTHRPSLLPIGYGGEILGLELYCLGNGFKSLYLEEG